MRLGCGCLVLALSILSIVGGAGWLVVRTLRPVEPVALASAEDGRRAQAKILEIVRRGSSSRQGRSRDPVVLSEGELNAFLERHLVAAADVPVSRLSVRLPERDRVELTGLVPIEYLLADGSLGRARAILPAAWLARPVAVRLAGRARVESGSRDRRYLRFEVDEFALGHQRLPVAAARLVLDPAALGLLRWRLPEGVEDVTIEPGRAVVRTVSSRRRSGAGGRR
jgi:hypothetical protein